MPDDYVTKIELREAFIAFELQLMPKIEAMIDRKLEEQRLQFERNVGAIAEHVLEKVQVLVEAVQMQIEKTERLRLENSADHERYESRLSRLESKKLFRKR